MSKATKSPDEVLRRALATSAFPMVLTDGGGKVVYANRPACSLLGLRADVDGWERGNPGAEDAERAALDLRWDTRVMSGEGGWYQLEVKDPAGDAEPGPLGGNWVWARFGDGEGIDADRGALTRREREVLGLVAAGLHTDEIAERLLLSPETVKSHVHNAMTKLRAQTRSQAVAIALVTGQVVYASGSFSPR